MPTGLPEEFTAVVEFEGELLTHNLAKNSIYGENTHVLVDDGAGELTQIDHGVDRSYLVDVAGYPKYQVYRECLALGKRFTREGSLVGEIPLAGESVTNDVVFEVNNYNRLYITTRKGLLLAIRK